MLAMKENVRVSCHLADRMSRRFHSKRTSRGYAEGRRAIRETREITPKKRIASIPEVCQFRVCWRILAELSVRDALAQTDKCESILSRRFVSLSALLACPI